MGETDCREVLKINASMEHDFITDNKIVQLPVIVSNSLKLLIGMQTVK